MRGRYDDYARALTLDPNDARALDGFVADGDHPDAEAGEAGSPAGGPTGVTAHRGLVARSKLLAADGKRDDAIAAAREAAALQPASPVGLEQLASLFADSADTVQLDATVAELREGCARSRADPLLPRRRGVPPRRCERRGHQRATRDRDRSELRADLRSDRRRLYKAWRSSIRRAQAFKKSLSFDAHDSTAYENLGVLELNAGNRALAARYFAEALWLVPDSPTARQGLTAVAYGISLNIGRPGHLDDVHQPSNVRGIPCCRDRSRSCSG